MGGAGILLEVSTVGWGEERTPTSPAAIRRGSFVTPTYGPEADLKRHGEPRWTLAELTSSAPTGGK
jgi:hypothetical protein